MFNNFQNLAALRRVLFRNMLETIKTAQTGHLGACCSSLDLMLVLYFSDVLRIDHEYPRHPLRDYVLNRGHLGPLKYNIFALIGWLEKEEMSKYREYGSRLHGHEDMFATPGVDITPAGSLGMGLSYAVGARIALRDRGMGNRIFCFLGDGEEQEGNVAEAARHAGHLKIAGLISIIDKNGGQLSTRLSQTDKSVNLELLWTSYGWEVININKGHDHKSIYRAYKTAEGLAAYGPVCIIANTIKGHGIPGAEEDYCGYHVLHGSEVKESSEEVRPINLDGVIDSLKQEEHVEITKKSLRPTGNIRFSKPLAISLPEQAGNVIQYDVEYDFLKALEKQIGSGLYILTSDYPPRNFVYENGRLQFQSANYYNVGLREQHMTAMAHGIYRIRPEAVIVVLCGDAFIYRHMDQINALAQAGTKVIFFSVQGGLSGAKNGSTHQSSGQPGSLLMIPGLVVEEPCSAEQFIRSCNHALFRNGPTYIRMQKTPVPWSFQGTTGQGFEFLKSEGAQGIIVTSGMIACEAFRALQRLREKADIKLNLVIITSLSQAKGFSRCIVARKPLFIYYNGNPKTLEYIVANDLLETGALPPWPVTSRGFTLGTTGSIGELLKHFKLDTLSIFEECLKTVKAQAYL